MPVIYDENAQERPSMDTFLTVVRQDTLSKVKEVAANNMDDRIERHIDHASLRKGETDISPSNDQKDVPAPKM